VSSEVIVDEAQDCGPEELAILTLLKYHGVEVAAAVDALLAVHGHPRGEAVVLAHRESDAQA
jgi:hypothetical protein